MQDRVGSRIHELPSAAHIRAEQGVTVAFVTLGREHAELADELRACFDRVLVAGRFVLGEEVERFEDAWATACGTRHCVGVASGTAALALLLRAAGIGPRTAAVVPVHLYGQMCDMEAIGRLADRHGLLVVEDAAQAHGAEWRGRSPGGFGAGAAFSFYPSKNLGALGDGGAICTDDGRIAEDVRRLRNLGQRRKGEHVVAGVNERLDALQAALLAAKLPHLAHGNALRRRHAAHYRTLLGGAVRTVEERPEAPSVHHIFPVRVPRRDEVAARLLRAGVEVAVHYHPGLRRQPALRDAAVVRTELPNADRWADEELSLPMSPGLSYAEIELAGQACLSAVAELAHA